MDPLSIVSIVVSIAAIGAAASALLSSLSAFARKARRPIKVKVGGIEIQLDQQNPEKTLSVIRQLLADAAANPRVALLYSSADRDFARRLAADLESRGIKVWIDEKNIRVGDNWPDKVERAIAESQWTVAVLPSEAEQSQWMDRELTLALKAERARERPLILPVLPPGGSVPPLLTDRIYADFRTDYDSGLDALVQGLKAREQAG